MHEKSRFFDNGKTIFYLGALFIVLSLAVNEWVLAWIFSPDDKKIVSKFYRFIVLFFQLGFFTSGIYLVKNQRRSALIRILKIYLVYGLCFISIICIDFFISYFKVNCIPLRTSQSLFVVDQKLGWKFKNNFKITSKDGKILFETDDKGSLKINTVADQDSAAIYFFGDSFSAMDEESNEDVFPYLIANKYLYGKVRAHNMAVMGYGIPQMYQAFLEIENQIRPGDLVIFSPISHDIVRTYQDFDWLAATVLFAKEKIPGFPIFENGTLKTERMESFYSMYNRIKIACLLSPLFGGIYAKLYRKNSHNAIVSAKEIFRQIKYRVEQKGAKFVLFFLPLLDEKKNGKYLVDVSGIDHIDLMSNFPADEKYLKNLYFKGGHYNQEGHRFVAKVLMKYLIDKEILDRQLTQNMFFEKSQ